MAIVFISDGWSHPGHDHHDDAPLTLQTVPTSGSEAGHAVPELRLPIINGNSKPWTSSSLNNDPRNFQFAIITDRTGGARPGIFESAMDKLNILQPEFVMSVGDLIQGYTRDENLIDHEWDELQAMVSRLQMPFFYVPGNHDMATPPEKEEWHRRFGANYYHFIYGNVLFLCLDSEEGDPAGLSSQQIDYFRKVLADHKDVRWTLIFMHRPLWTYNEVTASTPTNRIDHRAEASGKFSEFEKLLAGRKYTVYAGHVHTYTKYLRNDSKYIVLATTGGGSALRGIDGYGEFDQVAWITMTDDGPIMANLPLDGILDENVRTEEIAALTRGLLGSGVRARVTVTEPLPFTSATLQVQVHNPSKLPLEMNLQPIEGAIRFSPTSATLTISAKTDEIYTFSMDGSHLANEKELDEAMMKWRGTYKPASRPPLNVAGTARLVFDPNRKVEQAGTGTRVDGNLSEWESQWSAPQRFSQVIGSKKAWGGPKDATLQVAAQYDEDYVYVAARVQDDSVVSAKSDDSFKGADFIELFMGPEVADNSTTIGAKFVTLKAAPGDDGTTGVIKSDTDISAACVKTAGGYAVEMAVPSDLLKESGGQDWKSFRLNARILDRDTTGSAKGELWWKPDWESKQAYPDSGLFVR